MCSLCRKERDEGESIRDDLDWQRDEEGEALDSQTTAEAAKPTSNQEPSSSAKEQQGIERGDYLREPPGNGAAGAIAVISMSAWWSISVCLIISMFVLE